MELQTKIENVREIETTDVMEIEQGLFSVEISVVTDDGITYTLVLDADKAFNLEIR